jgi:Fic family protein
MNHGGLPRPEIKNIEWWYILKEETRSSILIEGVFVDKRELEDVLLKGKTTRKSHREAYNYYNIAGIFYNLMYEASKEDVKMIRKYDIKNLHSILFKNIENVEKSRGQFRKDSIKITGAKIEPPSPYVLNFWFDAYIEYVNKYINIHKDFLSFIAKQHVLFESIHPFEDGNGRAGRIITNGFLISDNYPVIIIKGDKKHKKDYYKALEEGDEILRPLTQKKNISKKQIFDALDRMEVTKVKDIIISSLKDSFDKMLISIMNNEKELKSLKELSKELKQSDATLRTQINRGEYIAEKRHNQWYTNKDLRLKEMITLEEFRELLNRYNDKGISESKFAELVGYSKQYINKIKLGKKPITESFSDKIKQFLEEYEKYTI